MAVAIDRQREAAAFLPMVPAFNTATAGVDSREAGYLASHGPAVSAPVAPVQGYSAATSWVAAISINAPRPAPSPAGRAGGTSR